MACMLLFRYQKEGQRQANEQLHLPLLEGFSVRLASREVSAGTLANIGGTAIRQRSGLMDQCGLALLAGAGIPELHAVSSPFTQI